MKEYKKQFIELAIAKQVVQFGEFTLKSGRISPYFFNSGLFNCGQDLALLGRCYAQAAIDSAVDFDLLFGAAYKGIPIVTTTAVALAEHHQRDLPYCFNRKEIKNHGEGGSTVGSPLSGKVLLIDDVITAGTAIRESAALIQAMGAMIAGILIAFDRQERSPGNKLSAIEEIEQEFNCRVYSIITLQELILYLQYQPNESYPLQQLSEYRQRYGI